MTSLHRPLQMSIPLVFCRTFIFGALLSTSISPCIAMARQDPNVKQHDGTLTFILDNGKPRRYKDNHYVGGGTFVEYRYMGYIRKIDAYVILAEKMSNQTLFLSKRTGKEVDVGNAYSISPNGQKIFSAGCVESLMCFYKITDWPSGKQEFFQKVPAAIGIPNAEFQDQLTPVEWPTLRWRNNTKLSFEASCENNGISFHGFKKTTLEYRKNTWRQLKSICKAEMSSSLTIKSPPAAHRISIPCQSHQAS
jgi:hypothetical protein